jgi:hypothetical protein
MDAADTARAEMENAIERAIDAKISFIEAARAVNRLLEPARFDRLSEPFVTFIAIDAETDAIPLAEVRDQWASAAVAKQKPEWDRAEAWAKEYGEAAFREALALVRKAIFPSFLEAFAGLEKAGFAIRKAEYLGHVVGSWSIEFSSDSALHRLVWDRRERWLTLQFDPPKNERDLWKDRWTGREPGEWSIERVLKELPTEA